MNNFNAAALLNEELTTIKGYFAELKTDGTYERRSQGYTWFCTHALARILNEGDLVLATARGSYCIAVVSEIHNDAEIDLDATFEYSFAFQRVRTGEFHRLMSNTQEAAKHLTRCRTQTLRTQVAAQYGVTSLKQLGGSHDADAE